MQGAGTFMARDAGVRACPWDREKFSNIGRRETRLKPSTRLPSYLADPSQNRYESDTSVWASASSQYGAHYAATAPAGGRAAQRRSEAATSGYAPGPGENVWQRTSDAFGRHYGSSDALGPVDLSVERIKHHKASPKKEAADTLRWVPRQNDGKSAALARFHAAHAEDGATDTLRWRADGTREDRDSRTHAPDRRRIVGLLARDDEHHVDGVALPPQRSAPACISGKVQHTLLHAATERYM